MLEDVWYIFREEWFSTLTLTATVAHRVTDTSAYSVRYLF